MAGDDPSREGTPTAPQMDALLNALLDRVGMREPQTVTGATGAASAAPVRRIGSNRRQQTLRMRRSAQRASAALRGYQRSRAAVGLAIVALIFVGAWLLNGYFTAQMIMRWGGSLGWGWGVHVVLTVTELSVIFITPYLRAIGAPFWMYILIWLIVLPFGIIDTGSSAAGFLRWAEAFGVSWGTITITIATLLAEGIAFVPEPALFWLALAFTHLLHER